MKRTSAIDFICIGAQKGGTTWLHARLAELSATKLPLRKEIHYFDKDPSYPSPHILAYDSLFQKLTNLGWVKALKGDILDMARDNAFNRERINWLIKYYFSRYTDDWYLSLFQELDGITGDITPSYSMLNERDVRRMKAVAPDAKIIFLMRNPIDRAWSHLRYNYSNRLPNSSFDEMKAFIDSDRQHLRSDYMRTIETYSNVFDDNQILLGYYDAIQKDPIKLLENVVNHIGGNPDEVSLNCKIHQRQNVSMRIDMPQEIQDYLRVKYYQKIADLSGMVGNYATVWLNELDAGLDKNVSNIKPAHTLAEI